MLVRCPQCDRQHRVANQLAGKRAKCVCGAVLSIPAAATSREEKPDDDLFGCLAPATTPSSVAGPRPEELLCRFRYGQVQAKFLWFFSLTGLMGLALIPIGIFWNDGWVVNKIPLPPLSVTFIAEIAGGFCVLVLIFVVGGHFYSIKHPKRVAITASAVHVPRGVFTTEERVLRLRGLGIKVGDVGMTSHLYLKHAGGTIRLSAFLFPTDADFDRFVQVLQRQARNEI